MKQIAKEDNENTSPTLLTAVVPTVWCVATTGRARGSSWTCWCCVIVISVPRGLWRHKSETQIEWSLNTGPVGSHRIMTKQWKASMDNHAIFPAPFHRWYQLRTTLAHLKFANFCFEAEIICTNNYSVNNGMLYYQGKQKHSRPRSGGKCCHLILTIFLTSTNPLAQERVPLKMQSESGGL